MGFNPLQEEGIPLEKQFLNWTELNLQPYDKCCVDPYTRCRIICLNSIEAESQRFSHQFARNTIDLDLRQSLALVRRIEQEQEKAIASLVPGTETDLEETIGYEQMEIDLTAYMARSEFNPYVKDVMDFGLLEDFDHLYRFANLLDLMEGTSAESIIGRLTEVIPGRPTVAQHRHPYDEIRSSFDHTTADILTKLHVITIVAIEQQTMNFYTDMADRFTDHLARGLYQEIAQIEEQHLTHYESLLDANASWLEMLVLHEYNECYLYYSFMQQETDSRMKPIWEHHLAMEIEHLKKAVELLQQYEGRDASEFLPAEFPHLTLFESNIDYVRDILRSQIDLTSRETIFIPVDELNETHRYFDYQQKININGDVPSQHIIEKHIEGKGRDYRLELRGPHPIERFRELEAVTR